MRTNNPTEPPQTILVNNMALTAVRTDLSEEDVDFTTEYQYVDGDVVDVACVNFWLSGMLTMVYPKADELSGMFFCFCRSFPFQIW